MVIGGYYIIHYMRVYTYTRTYERVPIMKIHYFKHLLHRDLDV